MLKKMMVAGFILFAGSQSVSAQDATQAAVNEAGRLRMVEIRNRVNSASRIHSRNQQTPL